MSGKRSNPDHPTYRRALEHHRAGRLAEAAKLYQQVLGEEPNHLPTLRMLALLASQNGRHDLAAELLSQAVGQTPKDASLHAELGEYHRRAGQLDAALAHCRQAVALQPYLAAGHYNLGVVRQQLRQLEDAATAYQQALHLDRQNANAHHNLGLVRRDQGRQDEAITAYQRALEVDPDHIEARGNLGVALHQRQQFSQAIGCFQRVLALRPQHAGAWNNLGLALQAAGRLPEALEAYQRAVGLPSASGQAFQNLGLLLEKLDRNAEAVPLFREALRRGVDSAEARYYMAAATGQETPLAAPVAHVRALFDPVAEQFDHHLVDNLQYRAPQDLFAAVCAAAGVSPGTAAPVLGDVLDLGCGTGLCAPLFKPLARTLTGVDLSAAMLEQARRRGLYDHLQLADLAAALQERPRGVDLILAADVFVYVGDLAPAFAGAAAALRPGGLFAFSVEAHDGEGYVLRPTRRYTHSETYLRGLAGQHRLAVVSLQPATIRLEAGQPVAGYIVVFRGVP